MATPWPAVSPMAAPVLEARLTFRPPGRAAWAALRGRAGRLDAATRAPGAPRPRAASVSVQRSPSALGPGPSPGPGRPADGVARRGADKGGTAHAGFGRPLLTLLIAA